jgi:hypothetical protein
MTFSTEIRRLIEEWNQPPNHTYHMAIVLNAMGYGIAAQPLYGTAVEPAAAYGIAAVICTAAIL